MTRNDDDSKQPQETISAAIEKLQSAAAAPADEDQIRATSPEALELVAMLHRTIPAQLQVMTTALDFFETYGIWVTHEERNSALALANAILKGEHR